MKFLVLALGMCAVATAAPQDLPLVEVPARAPEKDFLALMISGDGGWASLDQELSATLNEGMFAV